jgi:hypothetical protein
MPSSNASFTERRDVIQQFESRHGQLEATFTVEVTPDDEVLLKCFTEGASVFTRMNYDTAFALQQSISDALDEIEEGMAP